jgi:DNA-binding NarL/FixJ family response regulator/predicted RNase H-like HicB family nuclease
MHAEGQPDYSGLAVLLLDDDEKNRGLSAEIFSNEEARVVEAATTTQAESELIAHPGIDAVSLDVSLRGGGEDKEGAELAVRIHEARPELPIIGYSAYFAENELSAAEREAFTAYYSRGGSTNKIEDYVNRCLDEGLAYRRRRRQAFEEQLARLHGSGHIAEREYSVLRSFSPAGGEDLSIEKALTRAGYQVEVVLPTPPGGAKLVPRRPFVVWIREIQETDEYEAEVFGQPDLYGVGDTPEEAIHHLIEVFWLFVEDLAEADPKELAGPALSLAHFFEHVLAR